MAPLNWLPFVAVALAPLEVVVVFPVVVVVLGASVVVVPTPHILSPVLLPLTIIISELSHSVQFRHSFRLEAFVNFPLPQAVHTLSVVAVPFVDT